MFGTSTTGMTTSALETSDEKRMSNTSRLVKLFTVLGPGFHAGLLFAVFITSCVAFAKGSISTWDNRIMENGNDMSLNTYGLYLGLALGAFICIVPVTIVTARASCLSKGAQMDIKFIHREVLRTLWVIVPLIIVGWVPSKDSGPSLFGAFSYNLTQGATERNAGLSAAVFIHWAM